MIIQATGVIRNASKIDFETADSMITESSEENQVIELYNVTDQHRHNESKVITLPSFFLVSKILIPFLSWIKKGFISSSVIGICSLITP